MERRLVILDKELNEALRDNRSTAELLEVIKDSKSVAESMQKELDWERKEMNRLMSRTFWQRIFNRN